MDTSIVDTLYTKFFNQILFIAWLGHFFVILCVFRIGIGQLKTTLGNKILCLRLRSHQSFIEQFSLIIYTWNCSINLWWRLFSSISYKTGISPLPYHTVRMLSSVSSKISMKGRDLMFMNKNVCSKNIQTDYYQTVLYRVYKCYTSIDNSDGKSSVWVENSTGFDLCLADGKNYW